MTWLIALMGGSVVAMVALGIWLELRHRARHRAHHHERLRTLPASPWLRRSVVANLVLFTLGLAGSLFLGVQEALAQTAVAAPAAEISLGKGLALIGIGLPTALAAIGAALALGPIGSAALAVTAEKPEMFGRTLVYMGLAEGVAIYGLVMSILLLGKL